MKDINGLEKIINNQIKSLDIKSLVEDEIRNAVDSSIRTETKNVVRSKLDKIVDEEINLLLDEPVETNDGWGKIEKFDSFKNLFKTTFLKKLNENWEMKRSIERIVSERTNQLIKESQAEISKKIADELLK